MCILLKDKPLKEQIENTGITNIVCYKIYYRSGKDGKYKTPSMNVPLELRSNVYSKKPLEDYEFEMNILKGGICTLYSVQDALKYITLCGLGIMGSLPKYYDFSIAVVSGIIPENTNYVQGEYISGIKGYASEAFKPVNIIYEFSNNIKGRSKFYEAIRNRDILNK